MKKLLSHISLGIIGITLLSSLVFPVPVSSASIVTNLSLSSTSGTVGSQISVIGQNFAGTIASLYWDNRAIVKNISISDNGTFQYNLTIPEGARGSHTLRSDDNSNWSLSSASASFTVNPSISLFPDNISLSSDFTIYGHGFNKYESDIQILIDGKSHPTVAPFSADVAGAWAASLSVPGLSKGRHIVTVSSGLTNSSELGQLSLIITPYVEMKPASGPVGTQLIIYGWGFRQNEDGITILWDNVMLITNIRCEVSGNLEADGTRRETGFFEGGGDYKPSVFVPSSYKGDHTIVIYGSDFSFRGTFPDFHFSIIPSLQIQPLSGITGTQIDVTCLGFAENETLKIKYDDTEVNPGILVDKNGSMHTYFNAPKSQGTDHVVSVIGSKGNSLQAKFTSTDIPEVIPTQNQTPILPPVQVQSENQTLKKIEYLPPSLKAPSIDQTFYMFNSVGDVFTSIFKYLADIGIFLSGDKSNSKNTPDITFKWDDLNKISNGSYIFDLSSDDQFSNIVLEKNISSQPAYSLVKNLNLPSGRYFWRVKTVDNLGNASNWSDVSRFEISSMPGLVMWFSILISILTLFAIIFAIITIRVNMNRNRD